MKRYQLWFFDTRFKAGYADVFVWDTTENRSYFFEAGNDQRVYRSSELRSMYHLLLKDFSHLDDYTDDELRITHRDRFVSIEQYKLNEEKDKHAGK